MAVDKTIQMLEPYVEQVDAPNHLTSLFTIPRGGIHDAFKVKVDVRRTTRGVAFPMKDPSAGYHMNTRQGYSSKELEPAAYKEGFSISADELMGDRAFGLDPFKEPGLMARAQDEMSRVVPNLNDLIRRGMEIQASQIMQTCALSLVDNTNAVVFAEDFAPKATHFANASIAWTTTATAVPFTDIRNMCDLNMRDGKTPPKRLHLNSVTLAELKATAEFIAAMDVNYRTYSGELFRLNSGAQPVHGMVGGGKGGAIFRGVLEVANYLLDLWVYDGEYDHPYTGAATKYIADHKVIIESGGRMDATFGRIHNFGTDGRGDRFITNGRMTNKDLLMDMSVVAWVEPNGSAFSVGIGTRALLFPVAVDTFACLTTSGF